MRIAADVLGENERLAALNRRLLEAESVCALNLISSPGAGKTFLLEKTLVALRARGVPCAVVEGDQATDLDARRIALTGTPVVQIETGKSCHLDAHGVGHALERLALPRGGLLFIENVGNLICPSEFALGERARVVLASTAEGDDKPAKYPYVFRGADAVVITKTDLLPYVDFDMERMRALVRGLAPAAPIFELSARSGAGMETWLHWLSALIEPRGDRGPVAGDPAKPLTPER